MFGPRGIARTLLASIFVVGGVSAWRRSARLAERASPVVDPVAGRFSAEQLVRVNAGVHVVGGVLLALGVAPRAIAIVLGGSLVPTTLGGHRFWEMDDPAERAEHRAHVLKNAGLLGGLIFVALDTGGRPSVFWTGRRLAGDVASTLGNVADTITSTTTSTAGSMADTVAGAIAR